jgi:hypothetical protein
MLMGFSPPGSTPASVAQPSLVNADFHNVRPVAVEAELAGHQLPAPSFVLALAPHEAGRYTPAARRAWARIRDSRRGGPGPQA